MNVVCKKASMMAIAGGAAFWAANFATSLTPIAAEYRVALSIAYLPMIIESLLGGLILGTLVSLFLIHNFNRIPAKNPILKSLLLSVVALAIIESTSILVDLDHAPVHIVLGVILNVPRFLALGLIIGQLYERQPWSKVTPTSRGGV